MASSTSLSFLLVLAIISILGVQQVVSQCAATCDPETSTVYWHNSSTTAVRIRATEITVFPVKPDGSILATAYATFSLADVAELKASTAFPNPCLNTGHTIDAVSANGALALALNLSDACCSTSFGTGTLQGNVSRDMITINVTRPDWPSDFHVVLTLSFAHERVTIQYPAEPTILGAYNITYEYVNTPSEFFDLHKDRAQLQTIRHPQNTRKKIATPHSREPKEAKKSPDEKSPCFAFQPHHFASNQII